MNQVSGYAILPLLQQVYQIENQKSNYTTTGKETKWRRKRVTVGWPRRDPRRYRFALPNAIWEYKLKPIAFVIFSWFCHRNSHGQASAPTAETVAKCIHLSESTAEKYLAALVDRGLLTSENNLTIDSHRINSKNFFTLPNEVFLLNLPPSAFMVYAYLLLIENRQTHTCHPSYNTIASATGMAKNTVMKSIGVLLGMRLITMEYSQYFDKHGMKWNGNNLYTILPTRVAVDVFRQHQLDQLALDAKRRRIRKRQEEYDRRHPRAPLCATAPAPDNT